MKKSYVKPQIKLFDIQMEDRIASTCLSFVRMNFTGQYCYSFVFSLEDGLGRRPEDCWYSEIENS